MAKKQLTYTSALTELESLLAEIEGEELNVDLLIGKVKRATELLQFCKTKLHDTQQEIEDVLSSMDE